MGAEAPDVHVPQVQRRLALDDPLGHHLADPARARQAVGAEAGRHEEAATSVSPRQNSPSGVNASGPLMSFVTLTSSIAGTRLRELSTISSKRSQSSSSSWPLKSGGIASSRVRRERPRRGVALVAAHHQPAALLAEVDRAGRGRAASAGARPCALAERLRDQVLVGHRDDRHAHAGQPPDLGREHPAGVDDDLALDVALVRAHAGHAAAADVDPGHARVGVDAAPPRRAPSASA